METVTSRAHSDLHETAIVINALDSTHLEDYGEEHLANLKAGGVTAVNKTIEYSDMGFADTMKSIAAWITKFRELGWERFRIVKTAADIEASKAEGKFGIILGFQNSTLFETRLDYLDVLAYLGVRIIQLTYNRRNYVADGCAENEDGGLSRFGQAAVRALNERGILIDLSHVGHRSAVEAAKLSRAPVIVSHSSIHALNPYFRNVRDDLIRAVADSGGVLGICAMANFLRSDAKQGGATIEDYLDHVDYAVKLVGAEHVGVGLDVGHGRTQAQIDAIDKAYPEFGFPSLENYWANELKQVSGFPTITEGLMRRGYDEDQIRGIIGGNFLRVFRQVWG